MQARRTYAETNIEANKWVRHDATQYTYQKVRKAVNESCLNIWCQPHKTLIEAIAGCRARRLNVPVAVANPRQAKFFLDFMWLHGCKSTQYKFNPSKIVASILKWKNTVSRQRRFILLGSLSSAGRDVSYCSVQWDRHFGPSFYTPSPLY